MHREQRSDAAILLGLLDSIERDGSQTQRRLAADLGVALGLVNAYLKRCLKKGLLKVTEAPARRYGYYLTPHGFAEKSRLTVEYLSYSFGFFRQAKDDCAQLLAAAAETGFRRIVLAGKSDLAEIATICAHDAGIEIVAIVDPAATDERFIGLPFVASFDAVATPFDAVLLTDLVNAPETCARLIEQFDARRVLVPSLLRLRMRRA
jgi:DNA-binding MarR family transcriptional regulator